MWSFDYPSWIIVREAGVWHQQLNQWENVFHQAAQADLWHYATSFSVTSTPLKSANQVRKVKKTVIKKTCAIKRPSAGSNTVMKKPFATKKPSARSKTYGAWKRPAGNNKFEPHSQKKTPNATSFYKKYKYVVEVDESHLNKLRSGSLSKSCRAETDQVWVWGAKLFLAGQNISYFVSWTTHKMLWMASLEVRLRFLIAFAFSTCNPRPSS